MPLLPISIIIPTLNRPARLRKTLLSFLGQSVQVYEIIVIDASPVPIGSSSLQELLRNRDLAPNLICLTAVERGAAAQRNQGLAAASQEYILFADDDIDLEPDCLLALWATLRDNPDTGGSGAVITNQSYHPPGRFMRWFYARLGCPATGSLAGLCCGPALNFLPALAPGENSNHSRADWLNLGCTLYRRDALPENPFLGHFTAYSLMEDAALSLTVAKKWCLRTPHTARIYHDTQPADYKSRVFSREKMEIVNRWFVMRVVMGRSGVTWNLRQLLLQFFMLLPPLRSSQGWLRLPAAFAGKIAGLTAVLLQAGSWRGYPPSPKA